MPDPQEVTGGVCPAVSMPVGLYVKHRSTAKDIDASRWCPIYICDDCRALFVPEKPDEEGDDDT